MKKILLAQVIVILFLSIFIRSFVEIDAISAEATASNYQNPFEHLDVSNEGGFDINKVAIDVTPDTQALLDTAEDIADQKEYEKYIADNQWKIDRLRNYFAGRGSPLAAHAETFVNEANRLGMDYRLVPAISVIESGGCVNAYRPYNCWGWGGQEAARSFTGYDHSIKTVMNGIYQYYWAQGLTTPAAMQSKYCPPCTDWNVKVSYVMARM